jgi:hypothetical protein
LLNDTTTVEEYERQRFLRLKARAWPGGEAVVEFDATDRDGRCFLLMRERASNGPLAAIPHNFVDPILRARNHETLRRLALLAEKHH